MKTKNFINFLLVFVLLIAFFVPKYEVKAITIKDYRNQLANLENEKTNAENKKAQTQAEIDAKKAEIADITIKISDATTQQDNLNQEIKDLHVKIDEKEEQIKDLVSFYQVSSNENFYLKYLFGSDSFEDFIYRFSVIEQLTTKSDELVKEMNDLISENENKLVELENTKAELNELNSQAVAKIASLGSQASEYTEEAMSYDDDIASMKAKIQHYLDLGCGETDNISLCAGSDIPFDIGFNKPLTHGAVTDEFGMRFHPTQSIWKIHSGIDLGIGEGTPIYAAAAGRVSMLVYHNSCGGNQVVINHMINGVAYTTQYMHMLYYIVNVGDEVEKGQVIGYVGGGSTTWYDSCTTGAHLHFTVLTGHYGADPREDDYGYYSGSWYDHLINPRDVLYFPDYGVWW